jgi:hypothetical protein
MSEKNLKKKLDPKKAWKKNRKPQGQPMKVTPPPLKVTSPKGPAKNKSVIIPSRVQFVNNGGRLGLVYTLPGSDELHYSAPLKNFSGTLQLATGDSINLNLEHLPTPATVSQRREYQSKLKELLDLKDKHIGQLNTELRAKEKDIMALRAEVRGQKNPKKPNQGFVF